jgi:hypothetical protein
MKPVSDARSNASRGGRKTQWKKVWLALAVILSVTAATALAAKGRATGAGDDGQGEERGVYAIGLWGDLPYSDTQALVGVPNLIADMNSQDLAFTAHDGDLKAGSGNTGFKNHHYLCRRLVHAGAWLFQFVESSGDFHAWGQ